MYFVEKVKLKHIADRSDLVYPKHSLIGHYYTMEETLKAVKDCAKVYMTNKNLKFTDQTNPDTAAHTNEQAKRPKKITRYTMRSNHANKNVIDIYKEEEIYKEGWMSSSIKRTDLKIAYFVYTTYDKTNLNIEQCPKEQDNVIPVPPPNPSEVKNRVKGRLNNMGQELELIENHGKLVEELTQTSKYKKNSESLSVTEIVDEELKHLEELRKYVH